jgi:hypothetical protein
MCFSAEASFAGGVVISTLGILTVRKVHKPSQIIFASIPLFFGFQQINEGLLWLTIPLPEYELLQRIAMYIFQITALIIWPVMIPFSVLHMEQSVKRKKLLYALLAAGALLSLYYLYCLLFYTAVPSIDGFHIRYNNDFPLILQLPSFILYLVVTIVPLFVSSIRKTHLLGILMSLSCLVTGIFFTQYLTSVWCFFAALISGVIYWILNESHKIFTLEKLQLLKNPFTK